MSQSVKPEQSKAARAAEATMGFIAFVSVCVLGAIIIVPVGAAMMVRWAAGTVIDALRPARSE